MNAKLSAKLGAGFGAALCVFTLATANPDDNTAENPEPAAFERLYENIPSNWKEYYLDAETRESHKGEKVKKVCLDKDFMQTPQVYNTVRQKIFNNPALREHRFTRVKLLQGGQDFIVIDENHLVLSMPLAGNFLIETRGCKKNLDRAKYLRFTDEIDRQRVNRCLHNREGLSIQTRESSGFRGCQIRGIYEWDGPLPADAQQTVVDNEPEPIILK